MSISSQCAKKVQEAAENPDVVQDQFSANHAQNPYRSAHGRDTMT